MSATDYLIDTNILVYHTKGSQLSVNFISNLIVQNSFNISILSKIEFLGWDKHTSDGFEKCKKLIESANIYNVDGDIANKAIELKREKKIKLADAVIAATALVNSLKLATRNVEDFKMIEGLEVTNPLD
jgi:predicted nucleic acid-binding protein